MSDKTNAQIMAERYRAMADYLEAHPDTPVNKRVVTFDIWSKTDTAAQRRELIAAVGSVEKVYLGSLFVLRKQIAEDVQIEWNTNRENACRQVQVGEREVELPAQPAREARTIVEPVFEWRCDESVLTDDDAEVNV